MLLFMHFNALDDKRWRKLIKVRQTDIDSDVYF